jgi:hypothetical protein
VSSFRAVLVTVFGIHLSLEITDLDYTFLLVQTSGKSVRSQVVSDA